MTNVILMLADIVLYSTTIITFLHFDNILFNISVITVILEGLHFKVAFVPYLLSIAEGILLPCTTIRDEPSDLFGFIPRVVLFL